MNVAKSSAQNFAENGFFIVPSARTNNSPLGSQYFEVGVNTVSIFEP